MDRANPAHTRPIYSIRWENFRRLLSERALSSTDAAQLLGKTSGQVSHFGGKSPIKAIGTQIAAEIEDAFGLPRGWLDVPADSKSDLQTENAGALTVTERQLLTFFRVLSVADQRVAVRIIRGFAAGAP